MTKIFVDADACPVKKEIKKLADRFNVHAHFIASYAHMSEKNDCLGQWTYVDTEQESVDMHIINHTSKKDIVITHDIGLACVLLAKNVIVLAPTGKEYRSETMDTALFLRFVSAKERRSGRHSKGPNRFTNKDRYHFIKSLEKILSKYAGK